MGRGSKRQRKPAPVKSRPRRDEPIEDDSDDEIDAFHKQRDVIPLDANDDVDSDDDLDLPVFNLEGNAKTDSSESDDDDDEEDDVAPVKDDKETAKMARQAKYMEQITGGFGEIDDDDDEQEEERKTLWGTKKKSYYDAENVDYELQSSDDDLLEEEAAVKEHMRKKAESLRNEDFGIDDVEQEDSDSDGHEKTFQELSTGKSITKPSKGGALEGTAFETYREIMKDINSLSKEEQMNVVQSSAPELPDLLSELNEALNQLKKLKPVLLEVKGRKDIAGSGMHYLEVKHILLLTYCQAISFYLLLKSEGHTVRDHPVKARLEEIKNLSKKMKQIDDHLPSQIEELLGQTCAGDAPDKLGEGIVPLENKPDVMEVSTKPYEIAVENGAAALVDSLSNKSDAKIANQKHRDTQMGAQSMEMLKVRANLEAKLKQKGIYSLTNSKSQRSQNSTVKTDNRKLQTLDDFDDEVQQTAVQRGMNKVSTSSLNISKISQLVAAKANRPKFVSGDDDLPKRDDIGERRRKHELRVLAGAGAGPMDVDVQEDEEAPDAEDFYEEEQAPEEDEFYRQVKKHRSEKLKAKEELYSRTPSVPLPLDAEGDGKRLITPQMDKNRGLTRPRKKLVKIPRKKYRVKHKGAMTRRKGQVQDIRKPTGPYGGEHTGINTNVSRSRRLNS